MRAHCKFVLLTLCMWVLLGVPLLAQHDITLKPVSEAYAIKNVSLFIGPGRQLKKATLVMRKGIIEAVGENISIPVDAHVIDCDTMFAYPGFIDGLTQMGIDKPHDESQGKPQNPGNPTPEEAGITPYRKVQDYLKPNDKKLTERLFMGFTTLQVAPYGVLMPGQTALLNTGTPSSRCMLLMPSSGVYMEFSWNRYTYPGTPMGVMAKFRELYEQAKLHKDYQSIYASSAAGLPRPDFNPVLESLYPVVEKRSPMIIKCESPLEVSRALTLQRMMGFNLILANVKEGSDYLSQIKSSNASAFLSLDLPDTLKKDSTLSANSEKAHLQQRREEACTQFESQAYQFYKAGVAFGFSSLNTKSRDIKENINRMIKAGLPEDQALAALTINAAKMLGMGDKLGTLDKGKIANLFVSDRPYFDKEAKVRYVFVEGVLFECTDKPVVNGSKVPLEGSWTMTAEMPQGKSNLIMSFRKEGGEYKGNVTGKEMTTPVEFSSVQWVNGKLKVVYCITYQGTKYSIKVDGAVDNGSFKGNMNVVDFGSYPMEGKKNPKE